MARQGAIKIELRTNHHSDSFAAMTSTWRCIMKAKYLRLIFLFLIFCLFLFKYNNREALATGSDSDGIKSEQDERGQFLEQLYITTASQSEELINSTI
jgi:hypothetical protein